MKLTAHYCKIRVAQPRKAYMPADYDRVLAWVPTVNEAAIANYISQVKDGDTLALLRDVLTEVGKTDLANKVQKRADDIGALMTPDWQG